MYVASRSSVPQAAGRRAAARTRGLAGARSSPTNTPHKQRTTTFTYPYALSNTAPLTEHRFRKIEGKLRPHIDTADRLSYSCKVLDAARSHIPTVSHAKRGPQRAAAAKRVEKILTCPRHVLTYVTCSRHVDVCSRHVGSRHVMRVGAAKALVCALARPSRVLSASMDWQFEMA